MGVGLDSGLLLSGVGLGEGCEGCWAMDGNVQAVEWLNVMWGGS